MYNMIMKNVFFCKTSVATWSLQP